VDETMKEVDLVTLARAKKGDPKARTALVRMYQRPVYALASRMVAAQKRDLADDLAQESMLKVLEHLGRFDPNGPAKLSTWILTITTRTCIDALRRSKKVIALWADPTDREPEVSARADGPEETFEARELRARIEQAMAQLSDDQRAILILRAYHDLDYPEIASALGIEAGTVKSRLSRARQALKDAMVARGARHG
jgi:RNA polymerase sigma-70 factor (ECF subfamily)